MARWSCDDKTVETGRDNGAGSPAGRSRDPANGQHAACPPSRGDVTAVSPRLPSGALLAITVAMTAAAAVLAPLPAQAAPGAPGGTAASRAGVASQAAADKIRDQEWWLANLHVTQAWAATRGAGVTVAVLSSGVDADHPDLTGSVITGPDFTGSGETPAAPSWGIEGTSAAGIIAGHGDNVGGAAGIIGIAPAARILSVRVVLDATDPLNGNPAAVQRLPAAIAAGIRYAAAHGAQVIGLPLDPASLASDGAATGGLSAAAGGSAAEQAAVNYALGKGAVLVAPAGDNGEDGDEPTYPAAYPGVIAVGTVDRHFARAAFSNQQPYVALTAPGVDLMTASPPSGYRNMSTTDAASAVVAGIAALIRSRYPTLNSSQVRRALVTGSVPRPPSATGAGYGAGTVDALKAVQAAALIAAPRASPSASASSPAAAPPPTIRPAPPRTGILGRAKTVLRDAAMAAGMLILLLLASLIGIRIRRRRADRGPLPAPEPWTLLNAPPGPPGTPAGVARHTRAAAGGHAAGRMGAPGTAPWRTGPARPDWRTGPGGQDTRPPPGAGGQTAPTQAPARWALPGPPPALASGPPPRVLPVPGAPSFSGTFPGPQSSGLTARPGMAGSVPATGSRAGPASDATAPGGAPSDATVPGGRAGRRARNRSRGGQSAASPRTGAHGLRVRVAPVSGTVPRAQVTPPGGPPWDPAPMPEGGLPHDTVQRLPGPFASFAPPSPATSAPWDVAVSGPSLPRRGPFTSPGGPAFPAAGPASIPGPVPPPGQEPAESAGPPASWGPADAPQGPVRPLGRLRSAGPVPPVDPGFPAGLVPPGRAAPGGMSPEGRLPLRRPSSFAEPSGPAGPGHPAGPPETPAGSAGHDTPPRPPGGTGPAPVSPPDPPAGGAARPRNSPYSGRHASADGPGEDDGLTGPAGPGRDRSSGPLYIWNPAALTQPFPPTPPPRDEPEPPAGDTGQQP
jgi:subtilisin family serine protease